MSPRVVLALKGRPNPDRVQCVAVPAPCEPGATLVINVSDELQDVLYAMEPADARRLARELQSAAAAVEAMQRRP